MEFPHSQQVVADLDKDADSALELTVEMGFLHTKKKIFQLSELHSSENPLFHMQCIPSPRIISDCLIFYFLDASRSSKNSPSSLLSQTRQYLWHDAGNVKKYSWRKSVITSEQFRMKRNTFFFLNIRSTDIVSLLSNVILFQYLIKIPLLFECFTCKDVYTYHFGINCSQIV